MSRMLSGHAAGTFGPTQEATRGCSLCFFSTLETLPWHGSLCPLTSWGERRLKQEGPPQPISQMLLDDLRAEERRKPQKNLAKRIPFQRAWGLEQINILPKIHGVALDKPQLLPGPEVLNKASGWTRDALKDSITTPHPSSIA